MPKNKHNQATPIETTLEDNLEKDTKDHDPEKSDKPSTDPKKPSKRLIFSLITIALFLCIITGTFLLIFSKKPETEDETQRQLTEIESTPFYFYDNLTGEVISHSGIQYNERGEKIIEADGSTRKLSVKEAEQMAKNANEQPIYCIQIPNGLDGARPQVGLHRASIVFEAIAEVGITRFAAIFKNPVGAQAIGPIRSLRLYHLEWDTPLIALLFMQEEPTTHWRQSAIIDTSPNPSTICGEITDNGLAAPILAILHQTISLLLAHSSLLFLRIQPVAPSPNQNPSPV